MSEDFYSFTSVEKKEPARTSLKRYPLKNQMLTVLMVDTVCFPVLGIWALLKQMTGIEWLSTDSIESLPLIYRMLAPSEEEG